MSGGAQVSDTQVSDAQVSGAAPRMSSGRLQGDAALSAPPHTWGGVGRGAGLSGCEDPLHCFPHGHPISRQRGTGSAPPNPVVFWALMAAGPVAVASRWGSIRVRDGRGEGLSIFPRCVGLWCILHFSPLPIVPRRAVVDLYLARCAFQVLTPQTHDLRTFSPAPRAAVSHRPLLP